MYNMYIAHIYNGKLMSQRYATSGAFNEAFYIGTAAGVYPLLIQHTKIINFNWNDNTVDI